MQTVGLPDCRTRPFCRVVAFLFRSSYSYDMQSVHLEIRRSSPLTSLLRLKFFLSKGVSKKSAKVFVDRAFWLTKFSEKPHVGHDGALFSKRLLVRRLCAPVTTLSGHCQLNSRDGYHTPEWALFFNMSCCSSSKALTTNASGSAFKAPSASLSELCSKYDRAGSFSSGICLP